MTSWALSKQLESQGYLSLNKFVQYLKETHPAYAMSYPTAVKLVKSGEIKTFMIGGQHRVLRKEVVRWISERTGEEKSSPVS